MTIRMSQYEKPMKFKFAFHSVNVEIEDDFGGKFSSRYEILETVKKLTDVLRTSFPNYSRKDIEQMADEYGISYEETKRKLISFTVEQIIHNQIKLFQFFHKELEEILKIVLDDLLTDAQFYALSLFNYRLIDAAEFSKKMPVFYEKRRKERVKIISGKGRPQGKSLNQEEFDHFIKHIELIFQELEDKKQKITKTAVARKMYIGHSNPVQQLNRFFKRYDFITFDEILQKYQNEKEN